MDNRACWAVQYMPPEQQRDTHIHTTTATHTQGKQEGQWPRALGQAGAGACAGPVSQNLTLILSVPQ